MPQRGPPGIPLFPHLWAILTTLWAYSSFHLYGLFLSHGVLRPTCVGWALLDPILGGLGAKRRRRRRKGGVFLHKHSHLLTAIKSLAIIFKCASLRQIIPNCLHSSIKLKWLGAFNSCGAEYDMHHHFPSHYQSTNSTVTLTFVDLKVV